MRYKYRSLRQPSNKNRARKRSRSYVGILPKRGVGDELMSRAIGVSCQLHKYCKLNLISFNNNLEHFLGKNDANVQDGVHLSMAGVVCFANSLEFF